MVISDSSITNFVKVTALSSTVKSYIFKNIEADKKRIVANCYHISIEELPQLISYAKDTKLHSVILYDEVTDPKIRSLVRNILQPAKRGVTSLFPCPYAALHLTPTAPTFIVDVAYKALVARNHPDAGGSHEAFIALQRAYDQIKKERNPI
jgi:hypothetical protein